MDTNKYTKNFMGNVTTEDQPNCNLQDVIFYNLTTEDQPNCNLQDVIFYNLVIAKSTTSSRKTATDCISQHS
jgi:hypothetical protein